MATTYLGRYQLGDWVPMLIKTRNASNVITAPTQTSDHAPVAAVYSASGRVQNIKFSPLDKTTVTGLFVYRLRLSSSYSSGQYSVAVTYTTGSGAFVGGEEFAFEIVGGGNANGNVISMAEFLRPEALHVVFSADDGGVREGRNPY